MVRFTIRDDGVLVAEGMPSDILYVLADLENLGVRLLEYRA